MPGLHDAGGPRSIVGMNLLAITGHALTGIQRYMVRASAGSRRQRSREDQLLAGRAECHGKRLVRLANFDGRFRARRAASTGTPLAPSSPSAATTMSAPNYGEIDLPLSETPTRGVGLTQAVLQRQHLDACCVALRAERAWRWVTEQVSGVSCFNNAVHLILGSSSKVWNGGGELRLHSSVVAPSPQ